MPVISTSMKTATSPTPHSEHDADLPAEPGPIAAARSAEEKLRAYWTMKYSLPVDRQERLLAKLAEVEKAVFFSRES